MKEPLVIQKVKRLAELTDYADIAFSTGMHEGTIETHFSLYDHISGHTFPKTYKNLLEELDKRISQIEAANDK